MSAVYTLPDYQQLYHEAMEAKQELLSELGRAQETLRDKFAMSALPQVLEEWRKGREDDPQSDADFDSDAECVAEDCYTIAGAMMKVRLRVPNN